MNIEVEIKVQIDDFKEVRERLESLGSLEKTISQSDEYYVPSHRNFFEQEPRPTEWLRIRINPDKVIFEYDRSVLDVQTGFQDYAEEYETDVSHPENLRKILEFLDFKKVIVVEKQREYWSCGNFEVVLDYVTNLGRFIEVEAKRDFASIQEARKACQDFLGDLGVPYSEKLEIREGYPTMLLRRLPSSSS